LSAGLDSTSISLLAAGELARRNQRLTAFTSVPAVEHPWTAAPGRIQNEGPLAALVARSVTNIDHVLVDARGVSPIAGLRTMLRIVGEPQLAAGNYYWLSGLLSEAAQRGVGVLLTGQLGNHALSRRGPQASWFTELRRKRFGSAARLAVRPLVPGRAKGLAERYRLRRFWTRWNLGESPWRSYSPIRAGFAREVGLGANPADAPSRASGYDLPAAQLHRVAWQVGVGWKQLGAAFGISVRDPSQDVRLLSFALSIPDRLWQGPMDRWLFRTAIDGIVPDGVRLNARRGLQAADIVDRLRRHRAELDDAFREIEASSLAQRCLDLPYCRRIAATIDGPPDPFLSSTVHSVLMRGLGAGLFLAAFERTGAFE
jgi:asparagine synthase (glutamine-hydrolysing)